MREHPILFSAPMVRAILESRKLVTRRAVKPYRRMPIVNLAIAEPTLGFSGHHDDPESWGYEFLDDGAPASLTFPGLCPYGQPGDRLWIRETFAYVSSDEFARPYGDCNIEYRADKPNARRAGDWDDEPDDPEAIRWKPSIHMPRAASRITLEITNVHVERLHEISIDQIKAEGVQIPVDSVTGKVLLDISTKHGPAHFLGKDWHSRTHDTDALFRAHWAALWAAINGIDSWLNNPWVWVVEFKRIEQPHVD